MYVIEASNVNHAFTTAGVLARDDDLWDKVPCRPNPAGSHTWEFKTPVSTVYSSPEECVLFSPNRDANPFFHLFEALWILAGRDDVKFLKYILPRMADFSDNGVAFHGAYGLRLQNGGLKQAIDALRQDHHTRRAFVPIFDPLKDRADLATKDLPCNTGVAFRVRRGRVEATVFNRSNDIVWGAYGANAVQFSVLLQYVALHVGIDWGAMTQVSNSFHYYPGSREVLEAEPAEFNDPYLSAKAVTALTGREVTDPLLATDFQDLADPEGFDLDLHQFFEDFDLRQKSPRTEDYSTDLFQIIVLPAWEAFRLYRDLRENKEMRSTVPIDRALAVLDEGMPAYNDWRVAMSLWLKRRADKREARS